MKPLILVTGGGGFLGSAICRCLIQKGYSVRSFSRKRYPDLESSGVDCVQGDLGSLKDVLKATEGVEAIIHSAANAGIWGRPESFYRTNVVGTQNVLEAAQKFNVKRLVHTSSPSIVFQGEDLEYCDETTPVPSRHFASYPETKAKAEPMVIGANGKSDLLTVDLRPHLIWGHGVPHVFPRLNKMADSGKR